MKTNAKINVRHHVKRTHELFKNSRICNYTNALLLILILSVAILATQMFINNQNKIAPEAEIRFSELSKDKKILGTIMPASCESNPNVANGDGNYSGCIVTICWNGNNVRAAAGESCPPKPNCGSGSVVSQCVCDLPEIKEAPYYYPSTIAYSCNLSGGLFGGWIGGGFSGVPDSNNMCQSRSIFGEPYGDPYAAVITNYRVYSCSLPKPEVNIYFSNPNAIDPSGGGGNGSGDNGGNGGGDN